jgi:hypothetical protein
MISQIQEGFMPATLGLLIFFGTAVAQAGSPYTSDSLPWADDAHYETSAIAAVEEEIRALPNPAGEYVIAVVDGPVPIPWHFRSPQDLPASAGSSMAGRLTGPRFEPLPMATLILEAEHGESLTITFTDPDGSFEFRGMSPGNYRLRAESPGLQTADYQIEVESGERLHVRLSLAEGHSAEPRTIFADKWSFDFAESTEAVVLLAALRQGNVERLYRVLVGHGEPKVQEFNPSEKSLPFSIDEWRSTRQELAPFYDALVDIRRGPPRLYPYLPADMHAFGGQEVWGLRWGFLPAPIASDLSDHELRSYVASWLDFMVHVVWFNSSHNGGMILESNLLDDFSEIEDRHALKAVINEMNRVTAALQRDIEQAGHFERGHSADVREYMNSMLGDGLITKHSSDEDVAPPVRGQAPTEAQPPAVKGSTEERSVYCTPAGTLLHFVRLGSDLKLVSVYVGD